MSQRKRTSRVLENAELKFAGVKAIDTNLDIGDNYNTIKFAQLIEELRTKLENHNTILSTIDSSKIEVEQLEKKLVSYCENMMMGIGFKYGKDSREYQMAGGVRRSEILRKSRATRLKTAANKAASQNSQSTGLS
ncbi:hypothetical protein VF14_36785 [Nostoc linckia z18]|jgi:hypothetical protein|uniref:Uncharacterized protein n=2 Tax=Nostoc linckia TaxID=92942 RepID=A0A9Q6EHI6_NOSLI|nr:hypothetical protein [Nostoc linckia]PHK35608.1 hypothetical protein VF13_37450 [Nostoc linckia z16]PHJ56009.1 hypothetical protein VF05_37750 [Nostoc linckia z3]PHJ61435.1 hypothetical protein VF02_19920 [Nostoc linckia z1]PHJ71882.1 hypothetical protein VF03_19765 [Nostoc linckia z2]PHJ81033.1 hypothetical protein VF04_37770 [Nostoc linckia z7]